jgi:phage/conjugal plasmid C-4 type zinc finger TraR family protein
VDAIDIANDYAQRLNDHAQGNRRATAPTSAAGATHCAECDDLIPKRRRRAHPGATLCIDCAERWEKSNGR